MISTTALIEGHFPLILNICVILSACAFGMFAALALFPRRHTVSRRITILLAGVLLSSFLLFLPSYLNYPAKQ